MTDLFSKGDLNFDDRFVSVSTLSRTLSLSRRTIYRLIERKKLKTFKVSNYHLVEISSLKNIIEEV